MDAPTLSPRKGREPYQLDPHHPRIAARALRKWGVRPEDRDRLRVAMLEIAEHGLTEATRIAAGKVVLAIDAQDDRNEYRGELARQADASLGLAAVRTQLAAQLASDPGALASLSGGAVIPSLPAPVPAVPVLGIPDTAPTYSCGMCEDAGVMITSKGAYPCPNCSSDAGPADAADLAY